MAKNDWIATLMYNEPSSLEEVAAHGITPDNVEIHDPDYYKKNEDVQKAFTDDNGKFSEEAFDEFYNSALNVYNAFAQEDWVSKAFDALEKDPFDWTQPLKTEVKNVSATVSPQLYNPERRSMGINGLGRIGDPTFTIREIAQANNVRDEEGNKLDWSPNSHAGIFKSITDPTLAIAV